MKKHHLTQHALKHTTGVKEVDTNVETKTVVVEADDSVSPELMLEKLSKVSCKEISSRL